MQDSLSILAIAVGETKSRVGETSQSAHASIAFERGQDGRAMLPRAMRFAREYELSLAGSGDAGAIADVDRACFDQATTDPVAELERPWARLWVARVVPEATTIAFLLAWFAADEMHVLSVATLPAHRGKGIARALMDAAIDMAHQRETRLVLLEVRRSNEPALRLYGKLGFSVTGVRAHYYADGEDALEMALVLNDGRVENELGRIDRRPREN